MQFPSSKSHNLSKAIDVGITNFLSNPFSALFTYKKYFSKYNTSSLILFSFSGVAKMPASNCPDFSFSTITSVVNSVMNKFIFGNRFEKSLKNIGNK